MVWCEMSCYKEYMWNMKTLPLSVRKIWPSSPRLNILKSRSKVTRSKSWFGVKGLVTRNTWEIWKPYPSGFISHDKGLSFWKVEQTSRSYTLHGHILECVQSAKYLGCQITSDMRWSNHISNICGKANKTLGFLRRNVNINSTSVKESAYKSLVRPLVEYASSVWDPHLQKDITRLEMIQRRAARYVSNKHGNRSSVDNIINIWTGTLSNIGDV